MKVLLVLELPRLFKPMRRYKMSFFLFYYTLKGYLLNRVPRLVEK